MRRQRPRRTQSELERIAGLARELERRDLEIEALRAQADDPAGARQLTTALQENAALGKENSVLRRELRLAHQLLANSARAAKQLAPDRAEVCVLRRELQLVNRLLRLAQGSAQPPAAPGRARLPRSSETVVHPHIDEPGSAEPLAARADGLADDLAAHAPGGDEAAAGDSEGDAAPAQEGDAPMNDSAGLAEDGDTPPSEPPADEPAPRPSPAGLPGPSPRAAGAAARNAQRPAARTPPQSITLAAVVPDRHNGRTFGKRKRGRAAELGDDDFTSDRSAERTIKKAQRERDEKMMAKGMNTCIKYMVKAFGNMHENLDVEVSSTSAH